MSTGVERVLREGPLGAARGGRRIGVRRVLRQHPLGVAGGVVMVLVMLAAIAATAVSTNDPTRTDAAQTFLPPGPRHWFGTDHLGRDIYSRIVHGARVSLAVGLATSALGGLMGGAVGLVSGYARGSADVVIQPVLDIMQGFPLLVLALVLTAALGPSLPTVIIAIAVPFVPRVARVVRAMTLAIRESIYVEAARALGASDLRVAVRHIVPNTLAPLIVLTTAQLGSAILVEAALSFLGLGVPEPYPSWGRMLSVSAAEFAQRAPWVVIFPGAAISVVVFASNLLGDSLRDFLDPRLRI
jgi:peptide/nickel transport system permease protein